MPGTPNSRAIQAAQDLMNWSAALESMLGQARMLSTRVTQGAFQANWNAMATYTPNADGSQPASNDTTPITTHPIAGLNISPNSLQGLSYLVNDFITFMTNATTAPPAQNREATIETSLS